MYDELGLIYSEALQEVITRMSGINLQVKSQEKDSCFEEMTGLMILNGKKSGMLFVSAKKDDLVVLCSGIIGVKPAQVTDKDIEDTVCELVNMAAGNAKLRLSGTDFMSELTPPLAIKGRDMVIITKERTHVISGTLSNGEITVKFKVVY